MTPIVEGDGFQFHCSIYCDSLSSMT